jgi:hypothetical protein
VVLDPIELNCEIHLMAPGRLGIRRWHWELWHGPRMLTAGWRTNVLHAQRALRRDSMRYAHARHGLHLLRPVTGTAPEREWNGRTVVFEWGEVQVRLTPLEDDGVGELIHAGGGRGTRATAAAAD